MPFLLSRSDVFCTGRIVDWTKKKKTIDPILLRLRVPGYNFLFCFGLHVCAGNVPVCPLALAIIECTWNWTCNWRFGQQQQTIWNRNVIDANIPVSYWVAMYRVPVYLLQNSDLHSSDYNFPPRLDLAGYEISFGRESTLSASTSISAKLPKHSDRERESANKQTFIACHLCLRINTCLFAQNVRNLKLKKKKTISSKCRPFSTNKLDESGVPKHNACAERELLVRIRLGMKKEK